VACAINPVTGESQLSFFTEAEEIALGAEVDEEFLVNSGTYADAQLEAYVSELGHRLAAVSERPELPWSFRIADDEIVNAFALPGGRIYVTRGLLAHLSREAELVGVLGHEIGHVTARHSVHGLSRQIAWSVGIIAGLELLEVDDNVQMAAGLGLSLMFLKFGRNQERQADQLGVRYAQRAGFDPHGVVDALRVLQSVSHAHDDGWFPTWLSTHPDPDKRWQRLAAETGLGPGRPAGDLVAEVEAFLPRLDGMVYGSDPRNGILRDNVWLQQRHGYRMTFPAGWSIEREGQTLAAESPGGEALVMLLPQVAKSEVEAAAAFSEDEETVTHRSWDERLGGFPARLLEFETDLGDGPLRGIAAFVRSWGRVVAILGVTEAEQWNRHGGTLDRSVRSMGGLGQLPGNPRADLLRVVTLDRGMSMGEVARRYSPGIEPATLALLNQVAVDQRMPAGRRVKVIQAGG
jgi:predicted Zn-dependent protease